MKDDAAYLNILDNLQGPQAEKEKEMLEDEMGFSYREALGEILFAMVTTRPDISFPVIKLSKFANNPAAEHYQALKSVFRYLRATIDEGITYWRRDKNNSKYLQQPKAPTLFHQQCPTPNNRHTELVGSVDSDWASDTGTRRSVTGFVMYLAGGAVHYKSKYQNIIAHSSTESEFIAAVDAAKTALHLRSILSDIGADQRHATMIYEDNTGALLMANAKQPTRRTRHIDVKNFSIQDWVEEDLIILEQIATTNNSADHFTKPLARTLFYKHSDVIMGRIPPDYYRGDINPTYKNTRMNMPLEQ